jgi:hypothetical protein
MDEEIIPGHILNLICAIHLRQDHGYKAWTNARFKEHLPGLCTGDGGFRFTALHVLHHTRVGSLVPNDPGVEVADLSAYQPRSIATPNRIENSDGAVVAYEACERTRAAEPGRSCRP